MLTVLNLHEDTEEPDIGKRQAILHHYSSLTKRYHRHRKHAHRVRLALETICSVGYAIETKLFMFGFVAMIWVLLDVTMLLADDAD